jgi:hypothetical protein
MGRPKLANGKRRNLTRRARFTASEDAELTKAQRLRGLTDSHFLRLAALRLARQIVRHEMGNL